MKRSQKMQTQSNGIARVSSIGNVGRVPAASATKVRRGFTLVELLVVISIIGILIGLLSVAIGPVLRRVQDGAVTIEMQQLDLAIENFRNQYGFYPPTIGGTNGLSASAALIPFLNKMSANHREVSSQMPGTTMSRLDFWWQNIGQFLDERSSLVFWLSSVCANKQFPLTGGLGLTMNDEPQLPAAFGGRQAVIVKSGTNEEGIATNAAGTEIDIPRDTYFTFKNEQLNDEALNSALGTSPQRPAGIRVYDTPYGDSKPNRENAYYYVDNGAYDIISPTPMATYYVENSGKRIPVNANTFQLSTFGADGEAAPVALDDLGNDDALLNSDNITNFADGRLETFDFRANLGL